MVEKFHYKGTNIPIEIGDKVYTHDINSQGTIKGLLKEGMGKGVSFEVNFDKYGKGDIVCCHYSMLKKVE